MRTVIDLSNNNAGPISWREVRRAGCFGVLLKVSEGLTFADPTFPDRAREARVAGLHVGGYHFARPAIGSAVPEADYFCRNLGKVERRDLHPTLDLETNDNHLTPAELLSWVRAFQHTVRDVTGIRCLLYSYPAFITEQHWPRTPGTGAGLWLADYGPNDGHDHGASAPAPWRRIVAHQFTSKGRWPGVPGDVDLSHAPSRRRMLANGLRGL